MAEESENQISNICWIIEKTREFQEKKNTSISASLTTLKPLTVWITTYCGKFLEMGIPDHLSCLLKNLYAGQDATVIGLDQIDGLSVRSPFKLGVLTLTLPSAGVHSSLCWGSLFPPPHHNQLLLILQGSAVLSEGFLTPHVLLQFPMTVSSIIHHPIAH